MKRDFEFDGSGFGYLWLCIWTTVLTVITCGLFFPWAYSAQQRWICSNTYVNGRQLRFEFAATPTLTAGSCALKEQASASSFSG